MGKIESHSHCSASFRILLGFPESHVGHPCMVVLYQVWPMRLDLSVACEVLQTKPRDLASPHPPVKMSRAIFVAGAALLLGASCFVLPGSTPRGAPEAQVSTGRAAGAAAPEAESATAAFSPLALGAALGLLAAVVGGRPALAADLENGEAIFNGNCTACHANGNNSIVAEKKLKPGCTQAELIPQTTRKPNI